MKLIVTLQGSAWLRDYHISPELKQNLGGQKLYNAHEVETVVTLLLGRGPGRISTETRAALTEVLSRFVCPSKKIPR
jgi:hypothetical protein